MTRNMISLLKILAKHYAVVALILGVALVALPYISIDKEHYLTTHKAGFYFPAVIGVVLLLLSGTGFFVAQSSKVSQGPVGAGVDLTRVKERDGVFSATVGSCEIRVSSGHLEDLVWEPGTAVALPCNEYFDDECVNDPKSALGAYVNRMFQGQVPAFVTLMREESKKRLGPGTDQQKTAIVRAESYGVGQCILLVNPLGRSTPVALVSTTTQRASEGLAGRISYLFDGMQELVKHLADARLSEVAMPVLGAGHGGIDAPLAFVGLVLAIAEAARYGQGGQRLRRATIIVFKRDSSAAAAVNEVVVRRTLALIGSGD